MGETIGSRMTAIRATRGFDYLRLALAVSVMAWHSNATTHGQDWARIVWQSPIGSLYHLLLPMFFALSGFLVAGSLQRSRTMAGFVTLRIMRLVPALAIEVLLSAIVLGPLVTTLSLADYFAGREFWTYLLNIIGDIHYRLPGVFLANPREHFVNLSLWTVPFELECYGALILLGLTGIFRRRFVFLAITVAASVAYPLQVILRDSYTPALHPSGRLLIIAFLSGVSLYLYRDRVRLSGWLAAGSAALCMAVLATRWSELFAVWPAAYLTVWLGLLHPPKIPVLLAGDYSYGIYLFGWPIQQTVMWALPEHRSIAVNLGIAVPAAFLYAAFSWHIVEKPILLRKNDVVSRLEKLIAGWNLNAA